ncbi:MerR family transcriptional regulator [Nocardia farcinica]|uniref:Putative transcriptional regulator n=1 Tax=Nocardia farcinica (strain IFM 10152) TaxID=247156 RepID=Q5Z357_NOCFA|nr:MerR family transcriptional regulator [Nocardia farcinica]BAD55134.1 putative transcriptional regulator [Nocardia farcinica IFM 10152]
MTATVTIGEFARLSHLSVKTLRYYHDIGLLAPAEVDRDTGYRRYGTDQVDRAHLIRRLRELDMPLPEIRAVLAASDTAARDATLRAHLARMEAELRRTAQVVASLRALLTPADPLPVEYRELPAVRALALREVVTKDDIDLWCAAAFPRLYAALAGVGVAPAGPAGATYALEFFAEDAGEVTAFVPVDPALALEPPHGLTMLDLPARHVAIAVHRGPFEDFDRTYGALGSHVAEHDRALPEPVREIYLVGPGDTPDPENYRTEVCWPVSRS